MFFTVRSPKWIKIEINKPIINPSKTPSKIFSDNFGDTGASGYVACRDKLAFTEVSPNAPGSSNSCTLFEKESATAFAICIASCGDSSFTVTSIITVSMGTVALIRLANFSGVVSNFKSSMTGAKVPSALISCAYDLTRCCVKFEPCARAETSKTAAGVDTNIVEVAE